MTLYETLKYAGVPLDSHESDLYAKATPEARAILMRPEFAGERAIATGFVSRIDGARWIELPFCFDPFWAQDY